MLGPLATNCYVARSSRGASEAVVVDPSGSATEIRLALASLGCRCAAILVTHSPEQATRLGTARAEVRAGRMEAA